MIPDYRYGTLGLTSTWHPHLKAALGIQSSTTVRLFRPHNEQRIKKLNLVGPIPPLSEVEAYGADCRKTTGRTGDKELAGSKVRCAGCSRVRRRSKSYSALYTLLWTRSLNKLWSSSGACSLVQQKPHTSSQIWILRWLIKPTASCERS